MDEEVYRNPRIGRDMLADLSRRSDGRALAQLAGHLALIAAAIALAAGLRGTLWQGPALLLEGIALVFLFAPLHETIHRTAFKSRPLNEAVAWLCALPLMLPPEYFRSFHFAHHRHTQDPARDPELATPKPATCAAFAWQVSGVPYWLAQLRVTLGHAAGRVTESFIPARSAARVVREARRLWLAYAAIALGSVLWRTDAALVYGVLPLLLGQPFLRAYLLAEHTGCAFGPDMLANSRTTRTCLPMRLIAWNMPYHAEHHGWPSVPFHALPRLHGLIAEDLRCRGEGYIAVTGGLLHRLSGARRQG